MDAERYVAGPVHAAAGYLTVIDATLMRAIADAQARVGLRSGLARPGSSRGGPYRLLKMLARADERVMGADILFGGPDGQMMCAYSRNAARVGVSIDADDLRVGRSDQLDADELRAAFGPLRLVRIDGSHLRPDLAGNVRPPGAQRPRRPWTGARPALNGGATGPEATPL